jgi:CheY-like chemotaxis protein
MNSAADKFCGQRVLIVEDEYFVAQDIADYFCGLGAKIQGPVGSVAEALRLLDTVEVQGAILDINLRGERVYPVADLLRRKQVPFVFASGYGGELELDAYADVPRCIKPVEFAVLAKALLEQIECQEARRSIAGSAWEVS